jgi:hypothetical protein
MNPRLRKAHWRATTKDGRRWSFTWLPHARWLVIREITHGRLARSHILDPDELVAAAQGARLLGCTMRQDDPRQMPLFHAHRTPK